MSKPKTVKVRVAVDPNGKWSAGGYHSGAVHEWADLVRGNVRGDSAVYVLTAELEIPEPREVAAEVEKP